MRWDVTDPDIMERKLSARRQLRQGAIRILQVSVKVLLITAFIGFLAWLIWHFFDANGCIPDKSPANIFGSILVSALLAAVLFLGLLSAWRGPLSRFVNLLWQAFTGHYCPFI
jgi:hypothetical protein